VGLQRYRSKRQFSRTPEPSGKRGKRAGRSRFVVQKHDASRLHYDFRLELGGVLKSWAVPKGPSLDPEQKRLAVEVEDHPVEYGGFEGVIPKGQYGGGTVLVWDRGTWVPENDPVRGLASGKLEFELRGSKLKGSWTLVRMRGREPKDARNWLLIKHADAEARPQKKFDVTREEPDSVLSGRDLESVAGKRTRASPRVSSPRVSKARRKTAVEGARRARMPEWIEPQLASLVDAAPPGEEWLHETKFDGYRALCRIVRGRARWFARNGSDWTKKFASMSPALEALPVESAWIDGEVVVLRPDGTTSFQDLQNAFRTKSSALTYCAFDLLYLDGLDLRGAPLHARKRALEELIPAARGRPLLRYSDHVEGSGAEMLRAACRHHLEGIVSKRRDEPYHAGRGHGWLKAKCSLQQEFVIGGFTSPGGARHHFGALLLGYHEGKKLKFAGRVGTGFDERTLGSIAAKLRALETEEPPFADPPTGAAARGVRWVKPKLVGAVQFTGWTDGGMLRHPSFQGLREDKPAREVVREVA